MSRVTGAMSRQLTAGMRGAIRQFITECRSLRRHRRGIAQARRFTGPLKLNLGCGARIKAGWVNIDLFEPSADLSLDLREPLPFPHESCSAIYSEHFLEHVDYPEATLRLLRECRRVLQRRGVMDVGVPDTEWPLLEYAGVTQDGYFTTAKAQWHPKWCHTRLEHLNYHFRQDTRHRFAYDYETLEHVLLEAGFVKVRRRSFTPETDSAHRELGTLYVVAERGSGSI